MINGRISQGGVDLQQPDSKQPSAATTMNWHQLDIDTVYERTGTSPEGLSPQTASERLGVYGYNELPEKKKLPAWLVFLHQFTDFMILVLAGAAVIAGIVGEISDMIVILAIIVLNAIVGFIQEYRAEKAMAALKKLEPGNAVAVRNGNAQVILSKDLVPGDIVLLNAGSMVPADIRLQEAQSLRIEESALTGESYPAAKNVQVYEAADLPLGDRLNMAYKSTLVTHGKGAGIVIATGSKTEVGTIAGLLDKKAVTTPLQQKMTDFSRKLSYIIIAICGVVFGTGLLRGEQPMQMLLVTISLAVAAIPEALPALITISLAVGAKKLVRKHTLVKKLPAVETLGAVTYICTDKTGTLTENKMKVTEIVTSLAPGEAENDLPLLMMLNHDLVHTAGGWKGDPTEIALVEYAAALPGIAAREIAQNYPTVMELPFDESRKCMTTVHRHNGRYMVVSKGASEVIAGLLVPSDSNKNILPATSRLAAGGMRVLAYAYKLLDKLPAPEEGNIENGLLFAGLAGMIDPPRDGVKDAIKECATGGIHTVMITGDHPETAAAIAEQIGILMPGDLVISGTELSKLTEKELDEISERVRVYARVSPEQKLSIIQSLQRNNHYVAMTGDGVNDAPSLKMANIGIAMGITGTDISREAAHMILLDDNFATITNAIKEGRRIYDNIRKFVKYIMACNSAEIAIIFFAPLLGLPLPLLPIQILWINLVTDGLPGLALQAEKAEKNIMHRPPRKPNESLFAGGNGWHIIWVGLLMTAVTLATQSLAISYHLPWQTMVFTVLSLSQLAHVYAIRSERHFIFSTGIFSNRPLAAILAATFLLQIAVVYLPVANKLLKTEPLTFNQILFCIGMAAIIFHAVELEKLVKRRRK